VAVVTNIGEGDHLGLADIDTIEQLAKVKRCIVDVVAPEGYAVLNATDPHVVEMAAHCKGKVLFFAIDGEHPVIVEHRRTGGRAVFVRQNRLILATGDQEEVLLALESAPLTHAGKVAFQVENTLAAVAAAWCLGVPAETIVTRVECFAANMEMAPGRFNLLEINGATVIIDYGHNASSLLALIEVMQRYSHHQRTAVYSMAGDRRDCDLIRVGQLLGDSFDRVILYEDHSVRGRADGEIVRLIREGIAAGKRTGEVLELRGAVRAVEAGLQRAQPGEVVLIQADTIDETMDFLREYLRKLNARPAKSEKAGGPAPTPAVTVAR
jgi:cyanophycin synthetase